MKYADRLKVTSTGTSAATITMGAALYSCRTLAQCIADGDLVVGDTITLYADDGAGNWEDSIFTITSTTLVTRVSVQRSSAGGTNPAVFTGATLTVYNAPSGGWLSGLATVVVSASAPSNSDGRADGTIYIQTAS